MRPVLLAFALLACSDADKVSATAESVDADGDGYSSPEDCDDDRVTVNPGEPETPFNGRDDDCNPDTLDDDGDGDGVPEGEDCADADPTVFPGVTEICNEKDDNCDGYVDEGVTQTFFPDQDADGYGTAAGALAACAQPAGYQLNASDCDDAAPDVYPGATETCDERDENCDGAVDEGAGTWSYPDADADGFGNAEAGELACEAPAGWVGDDHDCDDNDAEIYPGATEVCDEIDQDCDGRVDDGVTLTFYADDDGDGAGGATTVQACAVGAGRSASNEDCDDTNAAIFPGAPEYCNGIDDDCDGVIDPASSVDATRYAADADGDGYGDAAFPLPSCVVLSGYVANSDDCDDANASVHPGATETCNAIDDDCDGSTDPSDSVDALTWYGDTDGDGYGVATEPILACEKPTAGAAVAGDCDDLDAAVHPTADEVCNGFDDDCDGLIDPAESIDATDWFVDWDGDGFGDPSAGSTSCEAPVGTVANDSDCDDSTALVQPGATEECNGIDDNCDGAVDPADSVNASLWYADADGDGFGFEASTLASCTPPAGHVSVGEDCDDANANVNPDAEELCNGIDDNCDATIDESTAVDAETWYADDDGDGYGDPSIATRACDAAPSGYVADDTDCHDAHADAYPGSTETEVPGDGIDTDCDGVDACTDLDCDGLPDLAVGNHYDGDYSTNSYVYFQSGSDYSSSSAGSLATNGPHDVDAADLDGDGYPDILYANFSTPTTRSTNSYIYWGSASGYSSSDRGALATIGALDAAISDLDSDGYLDLVFANYATDTSFSTNSYIYWGGAGGFSTSDRTSLATLGARAVLVDDLDEDGYPDLTFCNYYSGSTYSTDSYVYWGSSAGYSSSDRTSLATIGCFDLESGDVNGDGYKDLAFANYYNGSTYSVNSYVYYGSATGYSSAYRASLPTAGTIGVEIVDLNNDGFDDVTYGGHYNGAWTTNSPTYIYWGSSLGLSSSTYTSLTTTCGVRDPKAADLDSDGFLDLVLARYYSGSSYTANSYIYWGSATGFSDSDRTSLTGSGMVESTVADLDADGFPEVILASHYSGSSYSSTSYIYWGSAAGYSSSDRTGIASVGAIPPIVAVGNTDW